MVWRLLPSTERADYGNDRRIRRSPLLRELRDCHANWSRAVSCVITPEAFVAQWQGHRRLTRRMIEASPRDQRFSFSLGNRRTFGALALDMLSIASPMVRSVVS